MRRCPSCSATFRTGRRALVSIDGKPTIKLVCLECRRRAIPVVVPEREQRRCQLCERTARYCEEHRTRHTEYGTIDRALARLLVQAKASKSVGAHLGESIAHFSEGKIEGIEAAIALVRDLAQGRPL